jgi:Mn-containing catalase
VHDPLFKLKGGGPHFLDSQGSCWTAAYIPEGATVVRDLRANISAEAGARRTYEALIKAYDYKRTQADVVSSPNARDHPRNMFMKAPDATRILDDPFFVNASPDEIKLVFTLL